MTLGDGENVAVRLDDDSIDRKIYKQVLIAPVAISGTYLEEWRPRGGKYFEVLLSAIAGLRDFNLETTAVLWHSRQAQTSVGAWIFYRRRSPMAGGFASWRSSTISLLNAWRWSPIRRCPACVLHASLVP
jgi:hypothetical protein